jgi:uncharacterized repeat protein (TIGR01451 family)
MKQINSVGLALLWIALVGAAPVMAQSQEPKPLVISAINQTAESAKAADKARKDGALARPGDVLGYSLAFTNLTSGSVNHVQFVDPLPKGLVYRTGSARADKAARIEYSIDGGKSYAVEPMVVVIENGRRVMKPAPREAYSHIRWTVSEPLAPGAQVTAEFEAEVSQSASEAK